MPATPYSYRQYNSGSTFSVPFPYLLKSHVKVYLGYNLLAGTFSSELVDGVGFNWTSATQIQTTSPLGAGQVLTVIRLTPSDARLVDWSDGGKLTADDLDTADLQNLYVVQEQQDRNDLFTAQQNANVLLKDGSVAMGANLSIGGNRITNVATPTTDTDAVNRAYVNNIVANGIGDGDKGDIVVSNSGATFSIDTGAIVNADVNASAGIASSKLAFTQAGTGATQRTVEAKLQDVVSVKDFGAVSVDNFNSIGDGVTDDTAAIQAAINASVGKTLYFPPGVYAVYGQLNINTDSTRILGAGQNVTIIRQYTTGSDTFVFAPPTAGTTSAFQNNVGIQGLSVSYQSVGTTTGAGVKFIQCNTYSLNEITVNNAPEGIVVMGGQLGSLRSFAVFASNAMTPASGTALLHFRQAPVGASFDPCYTVEVQDFRITPSKKRAACIRISNSDGLHFSNGYLAFGGNSLVLVQPERDNSYVAGTSFSNVYFDCVGLTGTLYGIRIPNSGFANNNVYGFHIGSGCTIGNALQAGGIGILCGEPNVRDLSINGVEIINTNSWAVDFEGSSGSRLMIVNSRFGTVGDGSSGAIRASTGDVLTISNNRFIGVTNVVCSIGGNWDSGSVTGNINESSASDLDNNATFTNALVTSGNTGTQASATNNWKGIRTGNISVTDTNCLDHYLEGTFTPDITFNNNSVGVTYSSQLGSFTRIGNRLFYNVVIELTSKGSSTGEIRITGLPYTCHESYSSPGAIRLNNALVDTGSTMLFCDVLANNTVFRLGKMDTSGGTEFISALTDADISNTFSLRIAGNYRIKA